MPITLSASSKGWRLNEANIATAATNSFSSPTPLTVGTRNTFRVFTAQEAAKNALRNLTNTS